MPWHDAVWLPQVIALAERHTTHGLNRKVPQQLGYCKTKCAADPQHDREARHLRPALEVARVGRRDPSCLGKLLLRPAGVEPELADALPEDFGFDCHFGLSINYR